MEKTLRINEELAQLIKCAKVAEELASQVGMTDLSYSDKDAAEDVHNSILQRIGLVVVNEVYPFGWRKEVEDD